MDTGRGTPSESLSSRRVSRLVLAVLATLLVLAVVLLFLVTRLHLVTR